MTTAAVSCNVMATLHTNLNARAWSIDIIKSYGTCRCFGSGIIWSWPSSWIWFLLEISSWIICQPSGEQCFPSIFLSLLKCDRCSLVKIISSLYYLLILLYKTILFVPFSRLHVLSTYKNAITTATIELELFPSNNCLQGYSFGPICTSLDHFRQKWIFCPKWTK